MSSLGNVLQSTNQVVEIVPGKAAFSPEGGVLIKMTNKTGSSSVKGSLVVPYEATAIDNAFALTTADEFDCIGVVYEDGVADGSECYVVCSGIAQVLLQDSTASTRGYWARTSTTTGGRADCTTVAAPGLILQHFAEIGHCIESQTAGTNVLAKVMLHFN